VKQEFLTISSQKKMGNEHPAMPAILGWTIQGTKDLNHSGAWQSGRPADIDWQHRTAVGSGIDDSIFTDPNACLMLFFANLCEECFLRRCGRTGNMSELE
jgi:hypothetical protein